ncbi:hypothetical protein IDJ77_15205 [Mucilaginibacter sp. ZT4R22]|uniref:Tail specific protease domain-containing protein n=1 Tax=Mucilaginibacter pankratovii TaxID=2772110 RepID=A0ABR7WV95_9SPHI|nr:S41 family peptidase [Mucilaginibacter pankratovii]MBD1365162.1 hypothetical protein [Mucilaginibacter pankratovii]
MVKKGMIFSVLVVFLLTLCCSCKKTTERFSIHKDPQNFTELFDSFWAEMNINYVYWDIDKTNWDAIHDQYKPKFDELDIHNSVDLKKSVSYFKEISKELIDGHYTILFSPEAISDFSVTPAIDRKRAESSFHEPYLFSMVDPHYLDEGYTTGNYLTNSKIEITATTGTINKNILFFSCSGFELKEAVLKDNSNTLKTVISRFFDEVENNISKYRGIIIDLRNNQGGGLSDLNYFLSHLTHDPINFGDTRYKAGNGRLQFTPWISAQTIPGLLKSNLSTPLIVLVDNYTISLAEVIAMALRTQKNVKLVGETTFGATGPLTDNIVYNAGQFDVGGFCKVYTSSATYRYIDKVIYESKGFPPDIKLTITPFDFNNGKDAQLEKAINIIN